jgi:epoxide hydrolase-like predicted phosphatase
MEKPLNITALIFDYGGVLVRTSDPTGRRNWETRLGLNPGDLHKIVFDSEIARKAMLGSATEDENWQSIAVRFHLNPAQLVELQKDFWRGDALDTELTGFLQSLRPQKKTAILSNAWPHARQDFSRQYNLDRVVDLMVFSAEEKIAKPDERIYRIALDRLGVKPEESVFVDDMADNVQAALALGLHAIQFHSTEQALADLRKLL